MKKIYMLTILSVFHVANPIYAQTPLILDFSFEKDTLDLISPWAFHLEVINTADTNISVYPLLVSNGRAVDFGGMFVEIKIENDTTWEKTKILINNYYESSSSGLHYHSLQANGIMKADFLSIPPLELIKPGRIEARLSYEVYSVGWVISAPVQIYINEYKNEDFAAYQYIKKLKRPEFLLYPIVSVAYDTLDIIHAEYIALNFPESNFANFANLYMQLRYTSESYHFSNVVNNKEEMLKYLRLAKNHGNLALAKGDVRVQKKAKALLSQLPLFLSRVYYGSPPAALKKEFETTFKQ